MEYESDRESSVDASRRMDPSTALGQSVLARADLPERSARLAEVISDKIVPRLEMIHHSLRPMPSASAPTTDEIQEFASLVMAADGDAALVYFQKMRAKGHSLETLFEHFLAPTARYLGELWEQDICDFIDVTLGVARLQEMLTMFSLAQDIPVRDIRRRVMLFTVPGENHVFGIEMVAKFMAGAAWEVSVHKGLGIDACKEVVSSEWIGVIGATLSAEAGADALARTIESARRASANRSLSVLVGGNIFNEKPELVARVGADAAASNAPTAVILAKKLLLLQFATA